MLSCDNRTSSYRSLRRHIFNQRWLADSRPPRSRWCCSCQRKSFFLFGLYAAAVLMFQNSLITYHKATSSSESSITTKNTTTDIGLVDDLPTTTTAQLRSVVALSPVQSTNLRSGVASSSAKSTVVPATSPTSQPPELPTEEQYYSRRAHKVNEYHHNTVLVPSGLCRPNTFMVIIVHSSPTNVDRREAIRVTWGDAVLKGTWPNISQQNGSTLSRLHIAFMLGLHSNETVNSAVRDEHAHYNDIIQGDFTDHYHNMTLKSLLDLKVVDELCPDVQYLLKSDDDMVINLPYLLQILTTKPIKRSFMGPYNPRSRVNREGVWKLTEVEFPFAFYPPYESGSAYVITGDLIHELFVTAEYVPHIFVDDVYVTGILGRVLGITHVRRSGFAYWGSKIPTACDIVRSRIVTGTKMYPQRLCDLWKDLQLSADKCY